MKAARDQERAVAKPQDLGREDQEQQPAEQDGNAQVHQSGNAAGRRWGAPRAGGAERDPVEQRVERQQHQVVNDDRRSEPLDDLHRRRSGEAREPSRHPRRGDRHTRGEREQVKRARAVQSPEARHHRLGVGERHRVHPFRAVHPGYAGADDAGGIAVIERQVDTVDLQREHRALVAGLTGGELR